MTPVSTKDSCARIEGVHESIPTVLHVPQLSPSLIQMTDRSMCFPHTVKHNNDLAAKGNSSGIEVKTEIMDK